MEPGQYSNRSSYPYVTNLNCTSLPRLQTQDDDDYYGRSSSSVVNNRREV